MNTKQKISLLVMAFCTQLAFGGDTGKTSEKVEETRRPLSAALFAAGTKQGVNAHTDERVKTSAKALKIVSDKGTEVREQREVLKGRLARLQEKFDKQAAENRELKLAVVVGKQREKDFLSSDTENKRKLGAIRTQLDVVLGTGYSGRGSPESMMEAVIKQKRVSDTKMSEMRRNLAKLNTDVEASQKRERERKARMDDLEKQLAASRAIEEEWQDKLAPVMAKLHALTGSE